MKEVTIKLKCAQAQILFTELHAIVRKREEKIIDLLNFVADETNEEWDREVAKEQIDLYSFQRRTYRDICTQIRNSLFDRNL